jgi:CelD/BcsL family acetyltransferase involved in cellulose biosynthesis
MKVSVSEDLHAFQVLREEWNALLSHAATNSLFLTWEWQRAWWETFGADKELRITVVRDDSGSLVAIAPLFIQETRLDAQALLPDISMENPLDIPDGTAMRTMHLIGGTEVSDYLDIISSEEQNQRVWNELAMALEPSGWQLLDVRGVPAASPSLTSVTEMARRRGWQVQQVREDVCPQIQLPSSWDEYLATRLDKKQRHELRRKMRRAEEEVRVKWRWVDRAGFDAGMESFIQLHKASHPDKNAFMDERMQTFFRRVSRAALERDWLKLGILDYDNQAVAGYLCFDYGGDRLVYNSGFDVGTYGALSPGIVLLGYLIRDAIETGCKRFDFLQGNERYKYDLGAQDTDVMRVLVRR